MKDSIMKKLQNSKSTQEIATYSYCGETHLVLLGKKFFHEPKTSLFQLLHSLDSHTQLHWYLGLGMQECASLWQISSLYPEWLEGGRAEPDVAQEYKGNR